AAGWRARATLPLAALGYLIFGGILRHYSAFYHAGLVPLYVLAVLVFTPCVDAWSIDRRRRASRGLPVPEPGRPAAVYGWSRYACWTVVALAYAASGLSKLRNGGLHWWDAANVRASHDHQQGRAVSATPRSSPRRRASSCARGSRGSSSTR